MLAINWFAPSPNVTAHHWSTFWTILCWVAAGIVLLVAALMAFLFIVIQRTHPQFRQALATLFSALHLIRCYFLIYLWRLRFQTRALVPSIVLSIFVVAGIYTFLELVSNLLGVVARSFVTPFLESSKAWFEHAHKNPYVLAGLLLVEIMILIHHFQGHHHRHREKTTLAILGELLAPLNRLSHFLGTTNDPDQQAAARKNFMRDFSVAFKVLLAVWGVKETNVCMMEFVPGPGHLAIRYESSDGADFASTFTLTPPDGAAGKAFNMSSLIYIPHVKYEHGVALRGPHLDVIAGAYQPGNHPFKSILSVPIMSGSPGTPNASNVMGVLNLSSRRQSAFTDADFVLAKLGGTILSLMYD